MAGQTAFPEYTDSGLNSGTQSIPTLTVVFYAIFVVVFKEMHVTCKVMGA